MTPALRKVLFGPWTPRLLKPLLWFEAGKSPLYQSNAGTTASVAANDVVGYLGDLSGNGFHLTSLADDTTRPTLQISAAGKRSIRFDGTNDHLVRLAQLGLYNAGSCSVFVALKSNSNGTGTTLWGERRTAATNTHYSLIANTGTATTASYFIRNDANTSILAGTTPALTNAFNASDNIIGMIDDGLNINMFVDQGAAVTQAYTRTGVLSPDRFGIGASAVSTPSSWWAGDIYAMVCVAGVISPMQQRKLVTYLAALQNRVV